MTPHCTCWRRRRLQAIQPADQVRSVRILPAIKSQAPELYAALGQSQTRLFFFDYDTAYASGGNSTSSPYVSV